MKIGICTGGGDCPGLNAVIRAVVKHAKISYAGQVMGIYNSFNGLLENPMRVKELTFDDVAEILPRGGTILGTVNKGNTFVGKNGESKLQQTVDALKTLALDALIVVGGEGTQTMAQALAEKDIPTIGIPKTIDNDLPRTDQTIGFSSCVELVADSVMRLRSTAESHDRIMIIEVMGRDSGYIALHGGLAGGANVILLPEIPFSYEAVIKKIEQRKAMGRNFSLVVVSEGASEQGGNARYLETSGGSKVLGGIGQALAKQLFDRTGMDTRVTVLGHLQRGGQPNAEDRILATRLAVRAVDLVHKKEFGRVVVFKDGKVGEVRYKDINRYERRRIAPDDNVLQAAEAIGICLGR